MNEEEIRKAVRERYGDIASHEKTENHVSPVGC